MSTAKTFTCIMLPLLLLTACSKDISADLPGGPSSKQVLSVPQLNASCSRTVLLAGNEKKEAVSFNWQAFQPSSGSIEHYIIEADIAGAQFSSAIEVGNTINKSISFTVAELNAQLRKISIPGANVRFEFRVRLDRTNTDPLYSSGIALDASTYDDHKEYTAASTFRLPGNYQDWQVEVAPKAISTKGDGEYEGYVNMSISKPMFVMVKGATSFDYPNMYFDLGDGKFGPGKYIFLLPTDGLYKVNLSTKTYKWSYTRIEHFSAYGSATGQSDLDLGYDESNGTWSAIVNLEKGEFNFRANRSDKIKLGIGDGTVAGSLQGNGSAINVKTAGKYKLVLSVIDAGNYSYGLQRII